jgi:hypothetical protein
MKSIIGFAVVPGAAASPLMAALPEQSFGEKMEGKEFL